MHDDQLRKVNYFPECLQNRLISAVLEMVLSNTEKSCIAKYNRKFSKNIKIEIIKLMPVC